MIDASLSARLHIKVDFAPSLTDKAAFTSAFHALTFPTCCAPRPDPRISAHGLPNSGDKLNSIARDYATRSVHTYAPHPGRSVVYAAQPEALVRHKLEPCGHILLFPQPPSSTKFLAVLILVPRSFHSNRS